MILYLSATTNVNDLIIDFIEVQLTTGETVSLNWDESGIIRTEEGFSARYKGVYFGEEYANGRIKELEGMQVAELGLYSDLEGEGCYKITLDELEFDDDDVVLVFKDAYTYNWNQSEESPVKEKPDLAAVDFNFAIIPAFAEIFASQGIKDNVKELRFSALQQLQGRLMHYKKLGYDERILSRIAEKKGQMILTVSSKTEMEKALKPNMPHFDGNRFIPGDYHVPEEELICWSETSLRGPLNETGYKRYRELFRSIFPEEDCIIFGENSQQRVGGLK